MKLVIPEAVLKQHLVALGKTGAGKSSVLRYLVEWLLDQNKRVCIVDAKGDWWGIKFAADGKSGSGYPIIGFGDFKEPRATDVPINSKSGKQVAELIVGGNRPCVIGLRAWMPGAMTEFWIDFASTLFNKVDSELYLIISECHNFAPKGKIQDVKAGLCLHWTNRILSEARGLGMICLLDSQRPAKVHNDTLTCCETLLAMKVGHPSDRQALTDWIKGCGDEKVGGQIMGNIASLQKGQAYVWCPEIGYGPEPVQFPMFKTFDSFAPPQVQRKVSATWETVDLEAVKQKLAVVIEEHKANDPAELKRTITDLKRKLSQAEQKQPEVKQSEPIKVPFISEGTEWVMKTCVDNIESLRTKIAEQMDLIHRTCVEMQKEFRGAAAKLSAITSAPHLVTPISKAARTGLLKELAVASWRPLPSSSNALPQGERTILTALAQHPRGCTREQLTVITGYKRSSRDTYLQRLGAKGYCTANGDSIVPTNEGLAALGDFEPLPTGQALIDYHLAHLPEGERAVFQCVVNATELPREDIDELTGYKRSSRDTYIQRLSARQLVDTSRAGTVRISQHLLA